MPCSNNKPVFVVGSYRSGTSIFSWCLGQHPNLVNLPETNWLARLTVDLDNLYRLATINGKFSHLGQTGTSIDEFYRLFGEGVGHLIGVTNAILIDRTEKRVTGEFRRRRAADDPKDRWVDATPENSHYVYSLSKLFPEARFIHLLRNPHDVARSLMKFSRSGGRDHGHEEAYRNWTRLSRAAYLGEQAMGGARMMRVRYEEFTGAPERTVKDVLGFLGEPYCADCLKPLDTKINSSQVEPEVVKTRESSSAVREAAELYQQILSAPAPGMHGDPAAQADLQRDQEQRHAQERLQAREHIAGLDREVLQAQRELQAIYASTSWRITGPLRGMARFFLAALRLR